MEIETKTNGEEKEKIRGSRRHTDGGREGEKKLEADAERFQWNKHAKKCAPGWQGEEKGKKLYTFEVCLSRF